MGSNYTREHKSAKAGPSREGDSQTALPIKVTFILGSRRGWEDEIGGRAGEAAMVLTQELPSDLCRRAERK